MRAREKGRGKKSGERERMREEGNTEGTERQINGERGRQNKNKER